MKMSENKISSLINGSFYFDGQDLPELAGRYGTPLYVVSERKLKNNVKEIQEKFKAYHTKISVCYPAKGESAIAILQIIRNTGSDLEVNSVGALFKGLYSDFNGSQIIFNGVNKFEDEIETAITNNIKSVNADSEAELKRIADIAERLNKRVNITILMTADAAEDAVRYALENRKRICLKGYHFRIDARTHELKSFPEAFQKMLNSVVHIYLKTGYRPELLNVGGCLPLPHCAAELCTEISKARVEEWAEKENAHFFKDVELILTPGRNASASAGVFLSGIGEEKGSSKVKIVLIRENGEVFTIKPAQKYQDLRNEIKL